MSKRGIDMDAKNIPACCPLCAAPSDLKPIRKRKRVVAWRCSFCKGEFRLIVYKVGEK